MKKTYRSDPVGENGGRGFGELDETDKAFLTPDFNRKRQQGPIAVGVDWQTMNRFAPNAQLEGDDV